MAVNVVSPPAPRRSVTASLQELKLLMALSRRARGRRRGAPSACRCAVAAGGAPPDAEAGRELADLADDPGLVVLARIGAAPVELGVPRDEAGMGLAEPAEEPLAG